MIQRRAFIKRSPMKRRPRKPRKDGLDNSAFLDWLRVWPCYVCLRKFCEGETSGSAYQFFKVIEDPFVRSGFAAFTRESCGPTEAAHIGVRGLRQKSKDTEAMPLGRKHHEHATAGGGPESHHSLGKRFWSHHDLEPKTVIAILNRLYAQESGE